MCVAESNCKPWEANVDMFRLAGMLLLKLRWGQTDRISEVDLSENDGVSFGSVSGRNV